MKVRQDIACSTQPVILGGIADHTERSIKKSDGRHDRRIRMSRLRWPEWDQPST